jgi:hypothetical protein
LPARVNLTSAGKEIAGSAVRESAELIRGAWKPAPPLLKDHSSVLLTGGFSTPEELTVLLIECQILKYSSGRCGSKGMLTMIDPTRRTYEQRLDKLETIAARLSGELVMASGYDAKAAERLHHNLEAIETEIELLLEALGMEENSDH